MNNIINNANAIDNNDISVDISTTAATADISIPPSVATTIPVTGTTFLENTFNANNNVVATIDACIKCTNCSAALVSSANDAYALDDAQCISFVIANSTTIIHVNFTVSSSNQINATTTNVII